MCAPTRSGGERRRITKRAAASRSGSACQPKRAPVEGWRTAQEALGESTGSSQAAPAGSFSAAVIQRRNLIGLVDLSRPEGQQLLGWFEGATLRGGLGTDF